MAEKSKKKMKPIVSRSDMKESERAKALEHAMQQIEKQFGKGAMMKMGDMGDMNVESISSGCMELDIALGIGGIPRGRVIEIFGKEASGKTTVSLQMVASVQKAGGTAAFIDAEHALDPEYAEKLGVDIENLYISQPTNGEEALEIAEVLTRSSAVDMIVIDSVAALVPRNELEGAMGETTVGVQARLMSLALRKLTAAINRSNTIVVFINQLRSLISNSYGSYGGPTETTTGGKSLKFYASVRLEVKPAEKIEQSGVQIGRRTKITVKKNKLAPPFKVAEVDLYYGEGFCESGSILNLGLEQGLITQSGSWFSYKDDHIGQGKENARKFLIANPDVLVQVKDELMKIYHLGEYRQLQEESEQETEEAAPGEETESAKNDKKTKKAK